jgi:hypothetical protein
VCPVFLYLRYAPGDHTMNPDYDATQANLDALDLFYGTSEFLFEHLLHNHKDQSIEGVSVLLLLGLELFGGPESQVMRQLFPAMDDIRRRIDMEDLDGALRLTLRFRSQLNEIRMLVRAGLAAATRGVNTTGRS